MSERLTPEALARDAEWLRAYDLLRVAQDDGCRWPESWRECATGPDCNCRVIRRLAKATRIATPTRETPTPESKNDP